MKSEGKSKAARKMNRSSQGCLVSFGIFVVLALMIHYGQVRFGTHPSLRLVMETYYFGDGLAELTGDTSILEHVVTEYMLQRTIEHCNKGLCDGNPPPHVIGDHFKVVRETAEFAVVELNDRPLLPDPYRGYLTWCYSLIRDGDAWRVSGAYLDCDGYLPDRYK